MNQLLMSCDFTYPHLNLYRVIKNVTLRYPVTLECKNLSVICFLLLRIIMCLSYWLWETVEKSAVNSYGRK